MQQDGFVGPVVVLGMCLCRGIMALSYIADGFPVKRMQRDTTSIRRPGSPFSPLSTIP
jgi:hypothetical protein